MQHLQLAEPGLADDGEQVQRAVAPTGASPGQPGTAPPATVDIEDLARRLFDPLSARLKAELRLDRERAGLVTDVLR